MLCFALKILTNVTQDHLDFHKTIDEYIAVKSQFFEDESLKLINKDERNIRFNRTNAMSYGVENPSTYKVLAYSLKDGISAAIARIEKVYEFESPMHGFFNLYNLLCAISAVDMLNIAPMEAICEAVAHFGGVEGRMEVVSEEPLVIVDFAHTPDGMEKVLDSLKEKEIVLVFGAGGDRDRAKRPKMGAMAQRYAKKIIVTSDNPRSEEPDAIIREILAGMHESSSLHVKEIQCFVSHQNNAEEEKLFTQNGEIYYVEKASGNFENTCEDPKLHALFEAIREEIANTHSC